MRVKTYCLAALLFITLASPVFGGADLESANTEYLSLASAICTNYPVSISAWIRVDDATADDQVAVWIGDGSVLDQWLLDVDVNGAAASDFFRARTRDSSIAAADTGTVSSGVWEHIGGIATSSDIVVYPDGGTKESNAHTKTPTGIDTLNIGRYGHSSPTDYFNGWVAEVAVWCAALSDGDMTNLSSGDNPMTISPQPDAYWRLLNDGTDHLGLNDLTENGTITFSSGTHPAVDDPPGGTPSGGTPLIWLLLGR